MTFTRTMLAILLALMVMLASANSASAEDEPPFPSIGLPNGSPQPVKPGRYVRWHIWVQGNEVDWGMVVRIIRKSTYLKLQRTGTTTYKLQPTDQPFPWEEPSDTEPVGRLVPTWIFKRNPDKQYFIRNIYIRFKVRLAANRLPVGRRTVCFRLRFNLDGFGDTSNETTQRFCVRVKRL